ncbi:MAG: hypothetical protein ACRDG7_10105 [Candidatus Limnocylindria bacterium]
MTDNASDTRQPDAALRALDRLVGTWRISGEATGIVSYRWMEGGFFLVQDGELELYGHHNTFTEIIGRERPFGGAPSDDIKSRTYTSEGDTLDYVYELDGDTLTIWGGQRGSASFYKAAFSADGDTISGAWTWPGGGYKATSARQPGTTSSRKRAR